MSVIRGPIVDGIFYPDSKEILLETLRRIDGEAASPPFRNADAVVTPHAAFDYIGGAACSAYKSARDKKPDRVLILGPLHRERENGVYAPESEAFSTPLGTIPVDTETVTALVESAPPFTRYEVPHREEHCIEVQLPFIQYYFPDSKIIPLLLGAVTRKTALQIIDTFFTLIPGFPEKIFLAATVNTKPTGKGGRNCKPGNFEYFFSPENTKQFDLCYPEILGLLLHEKLKYAEIHRIDGQESGNEYSAYILRRGENK